MFIRTKYFNNGRAEAKVVSESEVTEQTDNNADTYIDEYDSIEEFLDEIEVELDDVVPLVLSLSDGKSVDITNYI